MYNILTLNKISPRGLKRLPECCYAIHNECKQPDGIILRSFAMHDMELPESLKAVARAGAGVNNIPLDKCSERGIAVFNTPGANANGVKELVLAGMLLSARDIAGGIAWVQGLNGQSEVAKAIEKGKADFGGTEISGKKLGVLGLGAIGVLVANAAAALGMEVMGYDPFLSPAAKEKLTAGIRYDATPDEIYAACDYISLHVPFNNDTKGMINAETIAKCVKGVRILNFSRAELVNNADMKKALEDGSVARYVTDFPNEEVLGVKGIITIPHLGASTEESEENCAEMAADELKDFLEKGIVRNSVNFPACAEEPKANVRVTIFHKGGSFDVFGGFDAVCKNQYDRNGYTYTVIDLNGDRAAIENAAKAIEGAIRVRVI